MSASSDRPPYEQPQAKWVCGNFDCGSPCALGPTHHGQCPESHPCSPRQDGDKWKCTRSKIQGGVCSNGPHSDGTCGLPVQSCAPKRSLRASRGAFVFLTTAGLLGAISLGLASPARNELVVPGGLTTPHAQILRTQGSDRCAACHEQGRGSFADWTMAAAGNLFGTSIPGGDRGNEVAHHQTELCIACHKNSIHPDFAYNPHTTVSLSATGQQLACATCHREHHGSDHDLTYMTTDQCNSCHARKYASFTDDHPEFEGWPFERRTRMAFTHAAHKLRHFPAAGSEFNCATCHQSSSGEVVSTTGFETSCASCHDQKIQQSFGEGLELVSLPMLDVEFLADNGLGVGQWPATAQGDFDGSFTPLVWMLLAADPAAQKALAEFGPEFDFLDIDPDNLEHLEITSDLIWAYKMLLRDLSVRDISTLKRRLTFNTDQLNEHLVEAFIGQLPLAAIEAAHQNWLPALKEEIPPDQLLFPRTDADEMSEVTQKHVATVRDDDICSLRLSPQDHAGDFMRYWIEQVLSLQGSWTPAELMLKQQWQPGAVGSCVVCHTIDEVSHGQLEVNWSSSDERSMTSFTKFSHVPHLTLPELQDCSGCHKLSDTFNHDVYAGFDSSRTDGTFLPIRKAQCLTCHNAKTTTDSCTTCHKYHVDLEARNWDSRGHEGKTADRHPMVGE